MRKVLLRILVPSAVLALLGAGGYLVLSNRQPESSSIKEVMLKLNDPKGNPSLTQAIGRELNEDSPPWNKIQQQSKEYAQLTATLSKYDPPKGDKESWTKLTGAYAEHAADLEMAAQHKDKDAALAAHKEITRSCMECHREHRAMRSPPERFSPGKFLAPMLIPKLDTDKDGKVSRSEMVAGVKQFYKDSDKDKKGSLDNKALTDGINRIMPMPTPPGGGPRGPGGRPPGAPGAPPGLPPGGPGAPPGLPPGGAGVPPMPPGGGMGGMVAINVMKRADKNKDDKVTEEELVAAAEALFDEVDKDKTGKLNEEGVGKAIDQLMPMPGGPGGPRMPPGVGGPPQLPPR
jgi:hypothetical protein